MFFRATRNAPDIDVVAINDLTDTETLATLLKYDSVHGTYEGRVQAHNDTIEIDGKKIPIFQEKDPEHLPWKDYNVDVVLESTGFFRTRDLAKKHLVAGAKKVLLSAPAKGKKPVKTIVMGVNEHTYNGDDIVSNASCTTNSLAPLVKVLDDNFTIQHGLMTTVHSYTGSQNLVDGPHKDLRRGRAAGVNLVPTTTGAAAAIGEVIPRMDGKLDGMAIRTPTPDGSITDLTVHVETPTSAEEINDLFQNVSQHHLRGVLQYTQDPLVSSDIVDNPHSVVFDAEQTKVNGNGHMVKVLGWYDNEWGYSNRLIDLARHIVSN
jgi:glyceraldehyde 3-phosphate dehydrogenase